MVRCSEDQIKNSFLFCGIHNSVDGNKNSQIVFVCGDNNEVQILLRETDDDVFFFYEDAEETEEN